MISLGYSKMLKVQLQKNRQIILKKTYHIDIIITIFLLGEDKGHVKCSIRYKMKLDHIVHLQKH